MLKFEGVMTGFGDVRERFCISDGDINGDGASEGDINGDGASDGPALNMEAGDPN